MLPDLVPRDDLLAAVSLSSAQFNLGRVIGPAAGRRGPRARAPTRWPSPSTPPRSARWWSPCCCSGCHPTAAKGTAGPVARIDRGGRRTAMGRAGVPQRHRPHRRGGPDRLAVHRASSPPWPSTGCTRGTPAPGAPPFWSPAGCGRGRRRPGPARTRRAGRPGRVLVVPLSVRLPGLLVAVRRWPRSLVGGRPGHRGGRGLLHRGPHRPQHGGPAAGPEQARGAGARPLHDGLGTIYPIGAVVQGRWPARVGIRAVTVGSAVWSSPPWSALALTRRPACSWPSGAPVPPADRRRSARPGARAGPDRRVRCGGGPTRPRPSSMLEPGEAEDGPAPCRRCAGRGRGSARVTGWPSAFPRPPACCARSGRRSGGASCRSC